MLLAKVDGVQLSKASIISMSIEILDSYGLADMTMRRVSSQLGVAPGALYWHFKNKQALIDATARHLLAQWSTTSFDSLETACVQLRRTMLAHRDGAELISAAVSDADLRHDIEAVLAAAIDGPQAQLGASTALHFVLGSTVIAQAEHQAAQATAGHSASTTIEQEAGDGSQMPAECDADSHHFLQGVRLIDSGLRALESDA
ncbi:TetR family transcriptional regulator [Corynebacterium pelargi]|uniref:Tetracycline repressor protein class H n=1 Tax=Corynebacterium pelargi TaxID=1471400 RepID=A0A410W7Z4_9CORY|nr:TetR family transcriptional regulator [Corynebacterium pelargi]QAU52070.1 Tetracycline repressor protein class H [Corynebacterium pelargi]